MQVHIVKKALAFRAVSFIATLLAARVWFGGWHITPFAMFLIPYCTIIYYLFDLAWEALNQDSLGDGGKGE